MTVPTKREIEKKAGDLEKHLSKLENPDTGKQKEKALVTLVRSAIRSSWSISPAKLAYYEMGRVPDMESSTLTKWKMQCECCDEWFKVDQIEIDHRSGNHSFKEVSDFPDYFDNILDIEFDDLQRICKYKCHRIKSHMEKQGLPDMETACIDKLVIFLVKYVSTADLTILLTQLGIEPESSAPKRKKQLSTWLTNQDLDYNITSHLFESCDHIMRLEAKRKKAKRFNKSKVDIKHIARWESFWYTYKVKPKTTLKVIEEK